MQEKLKIIFFCGERSPWGVAHLRPLLAHPQLQTVAVIFATPARWETFRTALSGPSPNVSTLRKAWRRFRARGRKDNPQRVAQLVEEHGVPLVYCDDVNRQDSVASFAEYGADVAFSAAYPQLFGEDLLSRWGPRIYNSHPSLLPKFRGAHPVFWAVAKGATETGGSIHVMTAELDQGDVVAAKPVPILETDVYRDVYDKLVQLVPDLFDGFVDFLRDTNARGKPQDPAQASYFRNDRAIHRRISWLQFAAEEVHNLVRACDSRAFFFAENREIRVLRTSWSPTNHNMTSDVQVPPGTVVDVIDDQPVVAARDGFVRLEQIRQSLRRAVVFRIGQILS